MIAQQTSEPMIRGHFGRVEPLQPFGDEMLRAVRAEQLSRRIEAILAASPKFGCLMAMLPSLEGELPNWAADNIPSESLHEEGIESETHCTVLYGFNLDFDATKLKEKHGLLKLKLGKVSRFECPEYDVLKLSVESEDLVSLNKELSEEFSSDITPSKWDYCPHVTIAYVKKGECKELDGDKTFEGREITVTQMLYSLPEKQGRVVINASEKRPRAMTERRRMELHKQAQEAAKAEHRKAVKKALAMAEQSVADNRDEKKTKGSFLFILLLGAMAAYAAAYRKLGEHYETTHPATDAEEEASAQKQQAGLAKVVDESLEALKATKREHDAELEEQRSTAPKSGPVTHQPRTVAEESELSKRLAKKAAELEDARWELPIEVASQITYGEAALRQLHLAGFKTKIWSQLDRPTKRHTHEINMNMGEQPLSFTYPNGQQYPGDMSAGVGEVANCLCQLVGGSRI